MWHAVSATAGQNSDFKRSLMWRNRLVLLFIHWPRRLLFQVFPRLLATEMLILYRRLKCRAYHDARLQTRAWLEAVRLLPRILRARTNGHEELKWTELLRPSGTTPEIRLPRVEKDALLIEKTA